MTGAILFLPLPEGDVAVAFFCAVSFNSFCSRWFAHEELSGFAPPPCPHEERFHERGPVLFRLHTSCRRCFFAWLVFRGYYRLFNNDEQHCRGFRRGTQFYRCPSGEALQWVRSCCRVTKKADYRIDNQPLSSSGGENYSPSFAVTTALSFS